MRTVKDLSCARWGLSLAACVLVLGCASEADVPAAAPAQSGRVASLRPAFCDREGEDAVRELFCTEPPTRVDNLHDLQVHLHCAPGHPTPAERQQYPEDAFLRYPVLLSHSTALSGQLVSPINPRALLVGAGTAMAFQRGVQQVEVAVLARDRRTFNFYLISFQRACDTAAEGCTHADLYTERIERDWTAVQVRDAEELANTPLDCRQCHQRGRDKPALLMRERESPWLHFLQPIPARQPDALALMDPGVVADMLGGELMRDYQCARGDEPYAGIDIPSYPRGTALILQTAVGSDQPLVFDSSAIVRERYPEGLAPLPERAQASATWERGYAAFKRGEQLALPYLELRATDPDKQAQLTAAYRRHRAGELADDALPDLADIFPDDPQLRARIGLQTEPDASAPETLVQACGPCHNDVLDQSLSRARFNIDLSRLPASELDLALERIQLAPDAPGVMPPRGARQLDPGGRQRLLEYLRGPARSEPIDPLLPRAAALGMAGGARAFGEYTAP